MFHSDQPIMSADRDELGRDQFVERLTRAILEWPSRESLVVGLYGPWGSGKTSVLNLLRERLNKPDVCSRVISVRFNPWLYGDTATLLRSFFSTFQAATGSSPLLTVQQRESLGIALDAISTFVVPVFAPLTQVFTGGVNLVTPAANAMLRATQAALKGGEQSFESQKDQANKVLKELASRTPAVRILVLIDDLDRTDHDEAIIMLKTIKLIADLPNVVYVLGLDYGRIQRILASGATPFDAAYLDKIIQVPITIPAPSAENVQALTFSALNTVLADAGVVDRIPPDGGARIDLGKHISWRVKTLRDRARLVNAFRFLFLSGDQPTDIDINDGVLISFLHVFFPQVSDRVRRHKALLTRQDTSAEIFRRLTMNSAQAREYRGRMIDLIIEGKPRDRTSPSNETGVASVYEEIQLTESDIESIDEFEKVRLKSLLTMLFPLAMTGQDLGHADAVELRRTNRVGSPDRFDRYFAFSQQFHVPPDSEVKAWIDATISAIRVSPPGDWEEWLIAGRDHLARWSDLETEARIDVLERSLDRLSGLEAGDAEPIALVVAFGAAYGAVDLQKAAEFIRRVLAELSSSGFGARRGYSPTRFGVGDERLERLLHHAFAALVHRERNPFRAVALAGEHANLWARRASDDASQDERIKRLEHLAINAVIRAGLDRVTSAVEAGEVIFWSPPYEMSSAVWRWRDLLRWNGHDYGPIRTYIKGLLASHPKQLPLVMGLFAAWSGEHPTLEHQNLSDLKKAAEEVIGWDVLLKRISSYERNYPGNSHPYTHLITQLKEKLERDASVQVSTHPSEPEAGSGQMSS